MGLKMKKWIKRKISFRASAPSSTTTTTTTVTESAAGGVSVLTVENYGRSNSSPVPSSSAERDGRSSSPRTRTRRIFRAVRPGDGRQAYTFTTSSADVTPSSSGGGEIDGLEGGLMLEMFLQSLLMRSSSEGGSNGSAGLRGGAVRSIRGGARNNHHHHHLPFFGGIMEDIDTMSYERLLELFGDGSENKGADEWSIKALPCATIQDVEKELCGNSIARQCMICLEDFQNGEKRKVLPCLHGFHAGCCDKWLGINASCPVCKFCIKGA